MLHPEVQETSDPCALLHSHHPGGGSGLTPAWGLAGLQQLVRGLASTFQFGIAHKADMVQPRPAPVLTVLDRGQQQHPCSAKVQGFGVSRGVKVHIRAELHQQLCARTPVIHVNDKVATITITTSTILAAGHGAVANGKWNLGDL